MNILVIKILDNKDAFAAEDRRLLPTLCRRTSLLKIDTEGGRPPSARGRRARLEPGKMRKHFFSGTTNGQVDKR